MSTKRDERTAKEITPEMIRAGVDVLQNYDLPLGPTGEEQLVEAILEAAFDASSEKNNHAEKQEDGSR